MYLQSSFDKGTTSLKSGKKSGKQPPRSINLRSTTAGVDSKLSASGAGGAAARGSGNLSGTALSGAGARRPSDMTAQSVTPSPCLSPNLSPCLSPGPLTPKLRSYSASNRSPDSLSVASGNRLSVQSAASSQKTSEESLLSIGACALTFHCNYR